MGIWSIGAPGCTWKCTGGISRGSQAEAHTFKNVTTRCCQTHSSPPSCPSGNTSQSQQGREETGQLGEAAAPLLTQESSNSRIVSDTATALR